MRTVLIWIAAAFVFGNFYHMVEKKQALLQNGESIYLALAPVDPRSFMQGDYMALNYEMMNKLNHDGLGNSATKIPDSGVIVIKLDNRGVGTFARYGDGSPLAVGEHLLKYHHDGWRAVIGAESFFIPEGSGPEFDHAVYGELKVEPDGTPLIVALCDKDLRRLSTTPQGNSGNR